MRFPELLSSITAVIRGREAEIRLAIRVTIAACAAYALARLLALPQAYWAVITAILIMQTSVGGSLKAALDRLGGTLAGAVYGALVSILIPHSDPVALTAAIAAATSLSGANRSSAFIARKLPKSAPMPKAVKRKPAIWASR